MRFRRVLTTASSAKHRHLVAGILSAACLAQAAPAAAQLQEIIVKARKREESILKVPVVANAISQEQLEQFATGDLFDVADQVPGFQLTQSLGTLGSQVSLRGVGTSVLNAAIDQSVSLNVDGLQMTQGLTYSAALFDMAQVTVLKGPQALFYGKASPGGVISIETADPGDETEIILRGAYENEGDVRQGDIILSGPVTDTLGLRLAGRFTDTEGWFENRPQAIPATGAKSPDETDIPYQEDTLVRLTAVWEPSDRLQTRLKIHHFATETEGFGGESQVSSCPDGTGAPLGIPFLAGTDCELDQTFEFTHMDPAAFPGIRNNGHSFKEQDQDFATLEINYDLTESWTLTSVTGYLDLEFKDLINGTIGTAAAPTLVSDQDVKREDFTEELRFTSDYVDSPFNYMVGVFYQDADYWQTNNVIGNTFYGLPAALIKGTSAMDIETWSVFGQVLWDITPTVELGIGARYTDEERSLTQIDLRSGTAVPVALAEPEFTTDNLAPEVSLTWSPTDELSVFAALKKAYKSGGYSTGRIAAQGGDPSYDDEKVEGGEAGIKSRLLDGTLSLEVAAYHYKFDNLQVGATESQEGIIVARTLNAASSKVQGIELDSSWAPPAVEGLTLRAAFNWNDAEYDEFDNAPCWGGQTIAQGCDQILDPDTGLFSAQDLSGEELLRAPDWSATAGLDYTAGIGNGLTLNLGLNFSYLDDYWTSILAREDARQDSYVKTNASIALRGRDDGWEVALIGNNITDEIVTNNCSMANLANGSIFGGTITGGTATGPAGIDELTCYADRGREVWLRLTLRPSVFFR